VAAKNAATAKTTEPLDYEAGGKLAEQWLRLDREYTETRARNPADPAVGFGRRGELTVRRDAALLDLRQWAEGGE
jgi:hypothetical protein